MMKNMIIILLACMLTLQARSQTKLTAERQQQVLEQIDRSAAGMRNMQCDFAQTRSMKLLSTVMKSKGVMSFMRPDKLRWQYVAPYDYTFILNGDRVHLKSSKSTKNIDVLGNKMFRQITSIILNCITGSGLKSVADFRVELYEADGAYTARLYPKKKELKQIYEVIEIQFNTALTMVSSVNMKEKTGDATIIKLLNAKINSSLDEHLFDIK